MKKKNILVLTYWSYKEALVQTYTLPFVQMIRKANPTAKIFLVTFEQSHLKLSSQDILIEQKNLKEKGIEWLSFPYFRFGLSSVLAVLQAIIKLTFLILKNRISYIHAFCTPAGTIGYILKKLTFTYLVIDSYEPHAENMLENGEWSHESKAFKILNFFEKRQTQVALHIIATTFKMKEYALNRFHHHIQSFFVKPAGVNTEKFNPQNFDKLELRKQYNIPLDAIVCVYIGKFGGIYYKEEIFQLIKAAQDYWKKDFYFLVGTPIEKQKFELWANQYAIHLNQIVFQSYIPHEQVPQFLAMADFGLNPVKPLPTKRYCTSVKDGEYWAMALPIVITPNISDDSDYIKEKGIGVIWEDTSYQGCLKVCEEMDMLLKSDKLPDIKKEIRQLAIDVRDFKNFEKIYQTIYG